MTPMSARLDDLRQRLAALRTRFAEVAARAAAAAAAMRASAVPAEALLDDLRGTAADFDELRLAILDEASTLPRAPDPARLGTLTAPDALVTTIAGAATDRARRAAWEAARDDALSTLDRVMTLVHREDTDFPPLAECQGKARELHAALSAAQPADLERITTMVSGGIRPRWRPGWRGHARRRRAAEWRQQRRPHRPAGRRRRPCGAAGLAARRRDPIGRRARAGRDAAGAARARGTARTDGRGECAVVGRRAPRLGGTRAAWPAAGGGGARGARALSVPALGAAGEERRVRGRTAGQ